jgi:hypothetical protein
MKPIRVLFLLMMILLLTACDSSFSEEDISRVYQEWVAAFTEDDGQEAEVSPATTRVPLVEAIGSQSATPAAETPVIPVFSTACNLAVSGMPVDVTIPDGTRLRPGQSFSKTWRLVNAGSCTWGQGYSAVWFSGEMLSQSRTQFLRSVVSPGQTIDTSIEMMAPKKAGVYQSNWKLSDPNANLFGIGPNGVAPFWVIIEVIEEVSSPTVSITATSIPVPSVYVQGEVQLVLEDLVDLDRGEINNGLLQDIAYRLDEEKGPILTAEGSARMLVFGAERPTHLDCQNLVLTADPVELDALNVNDTVCYRTNQALPGYFRLISRSLEDNVIELAYLTWAIP